jgi:hydroxypyruvate isomerase
MLKFAANLSMLFTELDFIDRFEAAKENGFEAVEIQFPYSLSAKTLKTTLDALKLKLVLFNVDADDLLFGGEGLACVPEKRKQFRSAVSQTLEYAKLLKPQAINVLPGRCLNENKKTSYLETFRDNLCYATKMFEPFGIKTVFEAINLYDMPGFLIHNGLQMLEILDQLKQPNLLLQYDIYHMQMMGDQPDEFIVQHADKIGHIQFADCPGRRQPGTGRINFDHVFSAIQKSTYSGWVGAEYNPIGTTSESLNWLLRA